jgi:hypothetical protein
MGDEDAGLRPIAEVERLLAHFPAEVRDIALELRGIVSSACPHAAERILWRGLSYHDPARGGPVRGAICQVELTRDRVRLSFIHGARLKDQDSLLQGDRVSKLYLEIDSFDEAPWTAVQGLICEASRLSMADFGPLPPRTRRGRS